MPKKKQDVQYYEAVGRRKEAVARVRLYIAGKDGSTSVKGKKISKGQMVVNGKTIENLFAGEADKRRYLQPLELTGNADRFAISIFVDGGGRNGQLEAIILGLSRALMLVDKEAHRAPLRSLGLLTRDPRARQRRMVGKGGKSRRQKQSPKR